MMLLMIFFMIALMPALEFLYLFNFLLNDHRQTVIVTISGELLSWVAFKLVNYNLIS